MYAFDGNPFSCPPLLFRLRNPSKDMIDSKLCDGSYYEISGRLLSTAEQIFLHITTSS